MRWHIDRQMTPPTKCEGVGCPVRDKCWRFVAPEYRSSCYPMQKWFEEKPPGYATEQCSEFWKIRKHDALVMAGKKRGDYL